MMVFRRAKADDLAAMYSLACHSGFGLTTLPKDKDILSKRLAWSCESFEKMLDNPINEYYLFVLEDVTLRQIVGVSAIKSAVGYDVPFYSYKLSHHTRICHSLGIRHDYQMLNLVNDNQGHSEICTLFLEPAFRVNGNGLLLSRARFLFMAHFPQRFSNTIIAEMRGISDDKGDSPFWEHLGKHFFQIPFDDADGLTLSTNKQFIADLMPDNPVYVPLLVPEAQAVIGKAHPSTVPAMTILLKEGFHYNETVDIFDGGPTIEASCKTIQTIANSRLLTISSISDEVSSKRFILSNATMDFRATISHAVFNDQYDDCIISKQTAELLHLNQGDTLRLSPLISTESKKDRL